jgi:hypothetical protein
MRHPHLLSRSVRSAAFTGLVALLVSAAWSDRADADWPTSPSTNLAICTATGAQGSVDVVSDGRGGAIFVWSDARNALNLDAYAQHVLADGSVDPAWSANGNVVCTAPGTQGAPKALPDGAGGALVFWADFRRSGLGADVYAGHLLANGQPDPTWPSNGLPVCLADSTQAQLAVCSDGAGGAYVAWWDWRNGLDRDVYLHHVLPTGSVDPAWPTNGLAVCVAAGDQLGPRLVADGSGGTIVAWGDSRTGVSDVYAQHVLTSGSTDPGWPLSGLPVCSLAGAQQLPDIASDGAAGAFIVWQDSRSGTSADVYSQHLLASGVISPGWPADGRPLCTAAGDQANPRLTATAPGQAIACWMDRRGANHDVYAGSVNGPGGEWPLDGRPLGTGAGDQEYPSAVPDGSGGAIVCWRDNRTGAYDVHAVHVLATGDVDPGWPVNGSALSTAPNSQQQTVAMADGAGGAIVAWSDARWNIAYPDIYAQRVQANGQLGGTVVDVPDSAGLDFTLDPVRPNPSRGGPLSVSFALPSEAHVSVELLDLAGRRLATRAFDALGPGPHAIELEVARGIPAGMYFVRVLAGARSRSVRVAILD